VRGRAVLLVAAALAGPALSAKPRTSARSPARRREGALSRSFARSATGNAGDGQVRDHLLPLPRNFTTGKFKVRTTPSGRSPPPRPQGHHPPRHAVHDDAGWPQFSDAELTDLAYYVKTFLPDFRSRVQRRAGRAPEGAGVFEGGGREGAKVYEDTGCISCPGSRERGGRCLRPTLTDRWGHPIRPADFTQRWTFGGPTRRGHLPAR